MSAFSKRKKTKQNRMLFSFKIVSPEMIMPLKCKSLLEEKENEKDINDDKRQ